MSRRTNSPAYLKIALDIASRIVNGDFIEGKKLSGRSPRLVCSITTGIIYSSPLVSIHSHNE